jgi:hypothetical protein
LALVTPVTPQFRLLLFLSAEKIRRYQNDTYAAVIAPTTRTAAGRTILQLPAGGNSKISPRNFVAQIIE